MTTIIDDNNPGLRVGDVVEDFRIDRVAALDEIHAVYYEMTHIHTGARYIHISTADTENTFSVALKTVPTDSTGVAHILEHTVLSGSKHFPVRDPFFSMLKRSLSTFMNALTASDWTMYPFSTQNRRDFYNLMDVYLDAVFLPNLHPLSFKQEGHRLEAETESGDDVRLVYKGVVYNEMKGAMSSPDQVMGRYLMNALYPDTTYSHNSGGDPAVIPTLTHEQLLAFHRHHYHPSNAFFYSYGNLPVREHLAFIREKVLKDYDRIDPGTEVPPQPRWDVPKTVTYRYPIDESEDPGKKSQVCVAWLTADIRDTFEVLVLTLLEGILLGNAASPLRKALIDSGLGSSLSDGTGFVPDVRDTLFASGLKDVSADDADRIEAIVFETLEGLVREGIDPGLIESAIHQVEFHRKEVTNSPYPYGIKLLLFLAGSWFHGGDPLRSLTLESDLDAVRRSVAESAFFEDRIRRYFLDNPHRVRFTLEPDPAMDAEEGRRVTEELDRIRAGMAPSEIEGLDRDAEALQALQDAEEDLSCLPTLALSDIPPDVPTVPETDVDPATRATRYDQPTSGIFYVTLAAGIGRLPPALLPLVPFFTYAFSRIGTARRDYSEMARRIDTYTGGLAATPHARTDHGTDGGCLPFLTLNAKCLVRNENRMFDILSELITEHDLSDLKRLKSLLLEFRAGLESSVVHNGHRLALSLACRHYAPAEALSEMWNGVHQLLTIKTLTEDLSETPLRRISEDLKAVGRHLFSRNNLRIALVGEADALAGPAMAGLTGILESLPPGEGHGFVPPDLAADRNPLREGWSTYSAVSFVAETFETVRLAHEDAPALAVISRMLRANYLHREIREKGGAYGGFATYNPENGLFGYASYRDPHIVETLAAFDGVKDFLRSGRFDESDIHEGVLQVCSDIDRPDPPGPAARKAFYRKLIGLTDEARRRYKTRLLALDRDRVLAAADRYFQEGRPAAVAVISASEALQAANRKLGDQPLVLNRI
jgi:presequence protease